MPSCFDRYRAEVDAELRSSLAAYRSPMYDMLRYHMGWIDEKGNPQPGLAGKALRPTLCLLACEAAGGDYRSALPAAAAIELIHNFSLIHDDVQDDDRERRHRSTVWSVWGKPQAINAGTAMRVVASLTMLRLEERDVPVDRLLRAQRLLDDSCLRLIEGQYLDISFESRLDVGVDDYLTMIEGKTASLIAGSLEIGALLGTDDERFQRAFRQFGLNIGFAFQIRDDILGIWGSGEKIGKPVGSDIWRRKKSLPIVYAFERARGPARAELMAIYGGEAIDNLAVQKVLSILEEVGARRDTQKIAEQYCDRALAEVEGVHFSPSARCSLEEMAHFLTERDF